MTLKLHCNERKAERCNKDARYQQRDTVMSVPQTRTHPTQAHDVASLRSRASSVVSTGTKFSVSTLPSDEYSQVDNVHGRSGRSIAFRPRSVLSAISYDQSLPPYDPYCETQSRDTVADTANPSHGEPSPQCSAVADQTQPSPTSPTTDPENALSKHYGRVVRTIDQNHLNQMRRLKEAHQEELGAVRHAIDQTYRKELKAKDREVEKMREEMAGLVATHEARIATMQREVVEHFDEQAQAHEMAVAKACNSIEDVWETRWNDRMRLADEETRRAAVQHHAELSQLMEERDAAIAVRETAIEIRDKLWIQQLSITHPEIQDQVRGLPATFPAQETRLPKKQYIREQNV